MSVSNKEVAALIVDFIGQLAKANAIGEEYLDSVDVIQSCITDSFEFEADEVPTLIKKFDGKSLKDLVEAGLSGKSAAKDTEKKSADDTTVPVNITEDDKVDAAKAESLKAEGNKLMAQRDFDGAIEKYTEAIKSNPKVAVYFSNRAAAYSSCKKHNLAIKDAEKAIELDPTYARAYSRLGLANFALGDIQASYEAYKKGLELEGDSPSPGMSKGFETAKNRLEAEKSSGQSPAVATQERAGADAGASGAGAGSGMPDLSNLMAGLGGLGGSGGMPDLGSLMSNPSVMQAAQQMMQDPNAMANLMNNPMISQMAQNFGLGGGAGGAGSGSGSESSETPSMSDLLNNPALRDMANSFMNNRNSGGN